MPAEKPEASAVEPAGPTSADAASLSIAADQPAPKASPTKAPSMPIVAIGASAGGLEAGSKLLDILPSTTGMAFIFVQHLDPTHPSLMVELLAGHTRMAIEEAAEGSRLAADHVYVIPAGRYLSVRNGILHLSPVQTHQGARFPYDFLLKSLADDCGDRTLCVILSGTGADGSLGLRAIKDSCGVVIAQEPEEAEYDGMPRSAIATGLVDEILPLRDIPEALVRLAATMTGRSSRSKPAPLAPADLSEIIAVLKDETAHDFHQYKPGTLERRIERRMALRGTPRGNLAAYLDLVRTDPDERDQLAKDLLINVTSFFRDPEVFDTLAKTILPDLISRLSERESLRVWIAGCSTGEEAYSIAMICRDAINAAKRDIKLQVFASDVDADAIAFAREGLYPVDNVSAIPADLLERYFVGDEIGYRISASLRGDVVFTVQDVLSDPPFSRIDLVSCRNLLIYLNAEAQAKVIALFHFALRPGGILVLGSSETVGRDGGRFKTVAKLDHVYGRVATRGGPGDPGFALNFARPLALAPSAEPGSPQARQATLADICRRAVLASHAPAAVLTNRQRQCLYFMGPTERFLRVAPGYATLDLLAMAAPALRTKLRLAIDRCGPSEPIVSGGRTRAVHEGIAVWFTFDVQWLGRDAEDLLLVCFIEESSQEVGKSAKGKHADALRIAELERELEATQGELQTAIQNQETASQEHRAVNEEALSVNEEYQSTNEELLTSKEELQSLNEELTALNSQLQETLERQRLASDDLQNVLYSTDVGTLFLDADLKIRFFTPAIKSLFKVIPGDIGRPLEDLRPIAADPDLLHDANKALADAAPIEREVSAPDDAWFLRRIFPYRAHDNRVEGVVITFTDITDRKLTAKALEDAKQEAERANLAKSRFLAAASHDLRQPLQSLALLADLLASSTEDDRQHQLTGRLEQTIGAMSAMLDALLDINQIEAGVVEPKLAAFPINGLLDRFREEFTYLALTHNLAFHVLPSAAKVESDPRLLEQMIRNLLGNAIKYTRQGKILLGCRRRGTDLRIEVWDSGIGIAEDEIRAIFEEFHQISNPARDRRKGLGLGLSIVQRLGGLLGHRVDVRSTPGKGSVFALTVPCVATADPPLPHETAEPGIHPDEIRRRTKIMIVDDDPEVLDLLRQMLEARGYVVGSALDAAAALDLIATGVIRPDILLTDYNLPHGTDGIDLLTKARNHLRQDLPCILLTGDISREALARIASEDCVHMNKPVNPRALNETIERLRPLGGAAPAPDLLGDAPDLASVTYVVDDDDEVRSALREAIERDGRIVEDFACAEDFLAAYRRGGDGCLLVDAYMPGMSGVALLEALRARGDHLPVILITGSGDIGLAVGAMQKGACDFIEKPVRRMDLLASIARAIDQSRDIRLVDAAHEHAAACVAALTSRQREVMELVLAGHPSKNIAADLGVSQRTVENHRAAIMSRMGVKSLPELARLAQAATAREDRQDKTAPTKPS